MQYAARPWSGALAGAALALGLACASSAAPGESDGKIAVSIVWNPAAKSPEDALWLGYLLARSVYVNEHIADYELKIGHITPSFEEESTARAEAGRMYLEMKAKDATLESPYFSDLARVQGASFVREYVWTYLRQPAWATLPDDLRIPEFEAWAKTSLVAHQPVTKGELRFDDGKKHPAPPRLDAPKLHALLLKGREVMSQGDSSRAIRDYFDPVIAGYSAEYKDSGQRVYSAENQMQAIMYTALPNPDERPVVVLDSDWSAAYLLKAYALSELKRVPEAQTELRAAIALSPMNSQYFSELAYTQQVLKDCDASIASYEQAASNAEFEPDGLQKTADTTRAWRGQGYCLVEEGKLDRAEEMYQKCLARDPHDDKAKGELRYIRGIRAKQK